MSGKKLNLFVRPCGSLPKQPEAAHAFVHGVVGEHPAEHQALDDLRHICVELGPIPIPVFGSANDGDARDEQADLAGNENIVHAGDGDGGMRFEKHDARAVFRSYAPVGEIQAEIVFPMHFQGAKPLELEDLDLTSRTSKHQELPFVR